MNTLIYRENKLFKINKELLPEKAKTNAVINALYAAVYLEFINADKNPKYKDMTSLDKINSVNNFALQWLVNNKFTVG
jgi:hypothetical protein